MAVTWDAAYKEKPPGTQSPELGDNRIRETRESIQERMTNAHYTVDDSQSTGSSATDWWHKMGSAKIWYQAAVPTVRVLGSSTGLSTSTSDDNGRLWFDSDATTPSLFVWNGTDFTTEIVGPATFVDMAEQTVTGAKTWSEAAIFSSTVTASDLNLSADNPEILGKDTNGALIISANTTVLGANIWLYGDTHATNAGDMIFQDDETLELHFDASTSIWDFQTNAIVASSFGFAGGTSFTAIQTGAAANDTIPTKGYVDDQVASVFAAGAVSATITTVGFVTLATNAEAVAGTITTNKAINPGSLTARLAAPGAIGGTTPAAGTFTTLTTPLGIGTDDPQELLHLLSSSTHSRLEIGTTATTYNAAIKLTTADTWQITSAGSGSDYGSGTFVISSEAGGARFYIDSAGKVGIGDKTENDDSYLYFASDAYIKWDEAADYFTTGSSTMRVKRQATGHYSVSGTPTEDTVYHALVAHCGPSHDNMTFASGMVIIYHELSGGNRYHAVHGLYVDGSTVYIVTVRTLTEGDLTILSYTDGDGTGSTTDLDIWY